MSITSCNATASFFVECLKLSERISLLEMQITSLFHDIHFSITSYHEIRSINPLLYKLKIQEVKLRFRRNQELLNT